MELFDEPELLRTKVKQLADTLRASKHAIAFTGAGISTSAGIPDFRSGVGTVLATGPGLWEKKKHGIKNGVSGSKNPTNVLKAYPTYTHMALRALLECGLLRFLISQNTDGLHRRSGVPKAVLAELHGNTNLEKCKKCKREFLRDFRVRNNVKVHSHETGRACEACGGALCDSIINFGENLPAAELTAAERHSEQADVCLVLGSSLTVTPAADCPEVVGKKGALFIANLQPTPLDGLARERLNGKCDDVMRLLMAELGIPVPVWQLVRGIRVDFLKNEVDESAGAVVGKSAIVPAASEASAGAKSAAVPPPSASGSASNGSSTTSSGGGGSTRRSTASSITGRGSSSTARFLAENRRSTTENRRQPPPAFEVSVAGVNLDEKNTPYTLFTQVEVCGTSAGGKLNVVQKNAPFTFGIQRESDRELLGFRCSFMGHYNEPDLVVPADPGLYRAALDFGSMKWALEGVGEEK